MGVKAYRISINDEKVFNDFVKNNEICFNSEEDISSRENLKEYLDIKNMSPRVATSLVNLLDKLNKDDFLWLKNKDNFALGKVLEKFQYGKNKSKVDIEFIEIREIDDKIKSTFRGAKYATIKDEDFIKLSEEYFYKALKERESSNLEEISKHENSGKISFTKKDSDEEKSLVVNPIRFLLPLEDTDFSEKEKLEIDYKEKKNLDNKDFEIIMEINPSIKEKNKDTSVEVRKNNLPMIYEIKDLKEVEEKTYSLINDYNDIFLRQVKLAFEIYEMNVKNVEKIQKNFFEEYFKFWNNILGNSK